MDMAWLLAVIAAASTTPTPVHVEVSRVSAHFATVSWDLPPQGGDVVIGFVISQERRDAQSRRVIVEVNTTERVCTLWGLQPDSDYSVRVSALSRTGSGPASEPVSFRTPGPEPTRPHAGFNGSRRLGAVGAADEARRSGADGTSSSLGLALFARDLAAARTLDDRAARGDVNVKELRRRTPELVAGELFIISIVLLMWAAVIGLFCRQYDLIKDNDSVRTYHEKQAATEVPLLPPPSAVPPALPARAVAAAPTEPLHGKRVTVAPVISINEM
ncbi:fibronectin type III domain-containing protein 4-like [Petromyzon marinus]|uniref:fibronectin type III domain-containing protein 4-like n=1 Tax=Petromyzon marinus TaxID=7757 RepID=UPI003F6E62A0